MIARKFSQCFKVSPFKGVSVFKVGDYAVHLSHGIGKVTGIEERQFDPDTKSQFLILSIDDHGYPKKVFIPVEDASKRLRKLVTKAQAKAIRARLAAPLENVVDKTWNKRYREYMEKIHTGEAEQIADVLCALYSLKAAKDLSFGERKLLEQAESLINRELEIVEKQ